MAVNRRQQRLYFSAPAIFFQLNLRPADLTRSTLRCCLHLVQLHPVLYHSKSSKDHPKNHLKIQTLLAKEEKPKGQNKNSLHVAQDLEGYSRKPANADELAQIDTDGNET